MMRATPDMPAPPIARKWTRPRSGGIRHGGREVEASGGERVVDGGGARAGSRSRAVPPAAAPSTRSASCSSARGLAQLVGAPRPSAPPGRASARAGARRSSIQSGVKSASSTSRPPPAATTSAALSRCSPLPTGRGRRRPAGRLRSARRPCWRPRARRRGRRRHTPAPCGRHTARRRSGAPSAGRLGDELLAQAGHVQHLDAAPAQARRRRARKASLRRWAPSDPPVTRTVGGCGLEAEVREGLACAGRRGRASRPRGAAACRCGWAWASDGAREGRRHGAGPAGPEPVGEPARAFCSWTTIGTWRRRAAR